jgi:hypothetical protein
MKRRQPDESWFDDAIDCVESKPLPTQLDLDGQRLIKAMTKFFVREFPGADEQRIAGVLDEKSGHRSPYDLFALRDLPIRKLVSAFYHQHMKSAPVKALGDKFLRMFDLHYARYEYARLVEHGVAQAGPFKVLKMSHGPQIEEAARYVDSIHEAALLTDLAGIIREEKPWLKDSARIIRLPEFGENLKGQILCEVLQAAVIDVVSSPLAKRHVFVWPTSHPERIGKLWQRMLRRNLDWPENLVSLTDERVYRSSFPDWLYGHGGNAFTGKPAKLPYWCQYGALIGGRHMEELIGRSSRIGWCIVENWTDETDLKWIQGLHEKCAKAGAALFVKGIGRKPVFEGEPVVLKDSNGADWDEWPEELRIREFPSSFTSVPKGDTGNMAKSDRVGVKAAGNEILALAGI